MIYGLYLREGNDGNRILILNGDHDEVVAIEEDVPGRVLRAAAKLLDPLPMGSVVVTGEVRLHPIGDALQDWPISGWSKRGNDSKDRYVYVKTGLHWSS